MKCEWVNYNCRRYAERKDESLWSSNWYECQSYNSNCKNVGLPISSSTSYLFHCSDSFQEPVKILFFYVTKLSPLSIQSLRISASKNRPILPNPALSRGHGFLTSRIPNQNGCDSTKNKKFSLSSWFRLSKVVIISMSVFQIMHP